MTYAETIDYLYNTLPMFSRMGSAAYKKDLTNTRLLCEALGHPQERYKTVHVGGTNGKGSVSHMLASVLQTAGYKTGLYTSPHLYDFRERIRLKGEPVPEEFVVAFTERVRHVAEKIQPSFFEVTVAMAFHFFAEQQVDVAVIEVGLGGRLDSTNIITPVLSIITNIGWDHMNLLGNSLPEIAAEKAGIIKPGVPVVIGETGSETKAVFEAAAQKNNATLVFADSVFQPHGIATVGEALKLRYHNQQGEEISVETDLPGIYQVANVRTVLASVELLNKQGFSLDAEAVKSGLATAKKRTGLQGRWEVIHRNPMVVLEVAHNPEGIRAMLAQIDRCAYKKLHLVFGAVHDKDIEAVLALLPTSAAYYFTQAHTPRALPAEQLAAAAHSKDLNGRVFPEVNAAVSAALDAAAKEDLIVVCGSIFLVAEVNRTLA